VEALLAVTCSLMNPGFAKSDRIWRCGLGDFAEEKDVLFFRVKYIYFIENTKFLDIWHTR
jgi:hypothetical protein